MQLRKAIENSGNQSKSIWLVAHFPSKFQDLQDQLESWKTDYDVITTPIRMDRLLDSDLMDRGSIKLVLSNLIPQKSVNSIEPDLNQKLALILVDRHPCLSHDERIVNFAKNVPCKSELGYYLALDDPVLKLAVNQTTIQLLEQMGLGENDLISSTMVSRRIDTVLKRLSFRGSEDAYADSAQQWLEKYGDPS